MLRDVGSGRLRAGIVGGDHGSFIGAVHRTAAEVDGEALVVADAMSSDPTLAQKSAEAWHLDRIYASYVDMARAEAEHRNGLK